MTKLISWNVNGLRACVGKNFLDFFHEADADVFCLQETKLQAGQIDLELPGYHQYWNYAEKKGYSGTALFTKKEPLSVGRPAVMLSCRAPAKRHALTAVWAMAPA